MHPIKSRNAKNDKPAYSFDSALDFYEGPLDAASDGTFYILKGTLSQWHSLAKILGQSI